jgi:Na+(H+)/acetate symporter ActP
MLYAIIFATGFAGMLHAPWWAAVVGGSVLALYLVAEDRRETLAYTNGDTAAWEIAQTVSSLSIAAIAAPIAFIAGQVSGLMWGV